MTDNQENPLRKKVIKALRTVHDPEIPVNIYDLGLIYELMISDEGTVRIEMTLTTPNCPMAEVIPSNVEKAVRTVDGITSVSVEVVWEPQWTPDRMSEAAKLELEFTGHTGPAHLRKDQYSGLTVRRTEKRNKP